MQKRLFVLLFLLTFIPAVVVMLVGWQTSQQQLEVLDSPGLHRAQDAALDLGRLALNRQKQETQQLADSLASAATLPSGRSESEPSASHPNVTWWTWPPTATVAETPPWPTGSNPREIFPEFGTDPSPKAVHKKRQGRSFLFATAQLSDATNHWIVVARTLSPELAATLDAVAQGGSGV